MSARSKTGASSSWKARCSASDCLDDPGRIDPATRATHGRWRCTAREPGAVEITVEYGDAPPAAPAAAFPIGARRGVEMGCNEAIVGDCVVGMAHAVEETGEIGLRRQVLERGTLQPVQGDMGGVEVDRVDQRRRAREIGKHVAAAGCDRHHAVAGRSPSLPCRSRSSRSGVDEAGKSSAKSRSAIPSRGRARCR